ncbi:MAG: polyphosphate kinase 1 [Spirochaetia bacterium]
MSTEEKKYPFINRELSWIEFNARVLSEGLRTENEALERLKFLSIVASNFDEFFMVRVASVKRRLRSKSPSRCPSGIENEDLIERISKRVKEIVHIQYRCLNNELYPLLEENGLVQVHPGSYTEEQFLYIENLFLKEIFPTLSPVRIERGRPFPFTGSLRLHIAFLLRHTDSEDDEEKNLLAIVQVPMNCDRFYWLPEADSKKSFSLIEDIIINNAFHLFPGYTIQEYMHFRVTRDADLSIDEERDEDFVEAMEELLIERQHSLPVRLEVSKDSRKLKNILMKRLALYEQDVYEIDGPLGLKSFMDLCFLSGFAHLQAPDWRPNAVAAFQDEASPWDIVKRQDVLMHHPYESYEPVVWMISEAATDPGVLAIKMTLYRTSGRSPIVRSLLKAAENGKQVTVLVEVKARFDEERNIGWAQQLERAGVIVVYGITGLKVHAKALLIIRKEKQGIVRYVHLATGNYNDSTAKLYTDLGMFTTNDRLTYEVVQFFNAITGYSTVPTLKRLSMAPISLKKRVLMYITREAERASSGNKAMIMAKMNSLADPEVIKALYHASQAGVEILLNVRGVCMLVPGVKGTSENIKVVSIVGKLLEHSRIIYFYNGGKEEVFLSSADWMPRNLDRRIELLFPVENEKLKNRCIRILETFFEDTYNAHELQKDESWKKLSPKGPPEETSAQHRFYEAARKRAENSPVREFSVRRRSGEVKK